MIIHKGFVLLLLRKLCVWQILQKGDPQFLPPPRYVTDVRDVMSLPENSSVSINWATKWATCTRYIQFLANVHWVLLQFVSDILDRCLCYERIITPPAKPTLCPPAMPRIVGMSQKTFFKKTGELLCKLMQSPPSTQ